MPTIFEDIYEENVGIAGLNYLALGIGLTGFSQINARLMDPIYKRLKKRNGGVGKPEFRLREFTAFSSHCLLENDIFHSLDGAGDDFPSHWPLCIWLVC